MGARQRNAQRARKKKKKTTRRTPSLLLSLTETATANASSRATTLVSMVSGGGGGRGRAQERQESKEPREWRGAAHARSDLRPLDEKKKAAAAPPWPTVAARTEAVGHTRFALGRTHVNQNEKNKNKSSLTHKKHSHGFVPISVALTAASLASAVRLSQAALAVDWDVMADLSWERARGCCEGAATPPAPSPLVLSLSRSPSPWSR